MNSMFTKYRPLIIVFIFFLALCLSRLINIQETARFIWDESSDLVNIHQIYVEKKLTLIGPISEDGSKVFGSLPYYMLLPFAILGNFDPASTAYGAAFWGIVGGVLLLYLTYKVNKRVIWLTGAVIILWYPLVETGRWAWNPNLIPLFITLSIICYLTKGNWLKFLSGLAIGLTIHLHYLSIFAGLGLGIVILIESVKERDIKRFLYYLAGYVLAILPFVIFDFMHPPGLFLSRILYFNNMGSTTSLYNNLDGVIKGTLFYFTQSGLLAQLLIVNLIILIFLDIKAKSKSIWFALVFIVQVIGLAFVANFYTHYILPGLVFFIAYLIYPRNSPGKYFSYIAILTIMISGFFSFPKQISKVTWEGSISSTRYISNTIIKTITDNGLKNNNIAVLGSPDTNTYGRRYRDLLLIKNINLRSKEEYDISDHLFVISESPIDSVRLDPAYEISNFRNGKLIQSWEVPQSPWKIYLFSRSVI